MGLLDFVPVVGPALDAISGAINAKQARDAFKSRYQDTVRDMRKAGLNPALAYGQGGGNPSTHDIPPLGESFTRAATGAASAKQAEANRNLTEAQTNLLRAQTAELSRRPFLENAQIIANTEQAGARTTQIGAETDYTRLRSVGQQGENTAIGIRNQILTIDQQIRELDRDYASLTLEARVNAVMAAAKQAGLNLTKTEAETALLRSNNVRAGAVAEGITGAKQLVEQGAEISATTYERLKEGVMNWFYGTKIRNMHRNNQINRRLGIQ
ncbi:MAG: DNA pilot protein [Microviridae sp.]|nr:MAG: DNA pilot protein [Microviridae sp.]